MKIKIHELSFSSLQAYTMCPQKFKYTYIDKVQPEFTPLALAYGSAIHLALETHNRAEMSGITLPDETTANILKNGLADESIDFETHEQEELITKGVVLVQEAIQSNKGEIVAVEKDVEITVANDFSIIGKIDLITEENGETVITDYKTANRKPSKSDVGSSLQLTTYSIAYPDSTQRIRALVKTKTPTVTDFDTTRSDIERQRVLKMFMGVKEAIEAGAFYPHESWACSSCQFYKRCHSDY